MIHYNYYFRKNGEIQSSHQMPEDTGDELTQERQIEMLLMMFPVDFYSMGMIVSKGYNEVFIPDYVETREDGKYIMSDKLEEVNSWQKQRS